MEFKDILKKLRNEKHLSQQELADKLQISRSAIGMYEQGKRKAKDEDMEAIADFFNVDMDYLKGKQPEKKMIKIKMPPVNALFAGVGRINVDTSKFIDDNRIITIEDLYFELPEDKKQTFYDMAMIILKGFKK